MVTKFSTDLFRLNSFWWEGPQFLKEKNVQNILYTDILFRDKSNELKTTAVNIATSNVYSISHIININSFSSFTKLMRVMPWAKRYVNNLKAKAFNETDFKKQQFLSADKIKESEQLWIIENQKVLANSNKFELLIKQLNIKPENNIYHCYGRLENAPLSFKSHFPIILSKEHKLAKLIISYVHSLSNHVGAKQTLNEFRNRF